MGKRKTRVVRVKRFIIISNLHPSTTHICGYFLKQWWLPPGIDFDFGTRFDAQMAFLTLGFALRGADCDHGFVFENIYFWLNLLAELYRILFKNTN